MINPRVDIAFKKIFGVEENKDILISLLNAIISEDDQIDEIELLNPYNERNFQKDKLSILDIKARNKITQTYFLIEMQLAEEINYHKRSLYSWSRVYANQLKKGDLYEKLTKVIAIHILNFTCIEHKTEDGLTVIHKEKYHHCFIPMDKETKKHIHSDFEIHTIELSKFENRDQRNLNNALTRVKTMLDAWVAVLTHYDLLNSDTLPNQLNKPEIRKALQVMKDMTLSETEREQYQSHLDFLRIEIGAFEARYRKGLEEGKAQGKAEGKAEGLSEGKMKSKIEIAKNMLLLNLPLSIITATTELTEKEIQDLIKKEKHIKHKK